MRDGATEGRESVRDRMIDGAGTQEACSLDTSQNFCQRAKPNRESFLTSHPGEL